MPVLKDKKVKVIKEFKEFDSSTYLYWLKSMVLMRRFEEMAGRLYGQQKIAGFCHLYIGQEACVAGCVSALKEGDKYITSYRDHAHPIALGTNPDYIMAELFGKSTGISKGKGGSMHMFDKKKNFFGGHGIVGNQIPIGAGIAFSEKYKKTDNVCITFLGDGAVRIGAFHEALNISMFLKLPVIFVIENNGYAMGTSVKRTASHEDIWKLGLGYEMPCGPVDAMNPEKVAEAMDEAISRARSGGGPTFLDLKTYRYRGHSMSDAQKYRTKDEVKEYQKIDPITQVLDKIKENDWASEDEIKKIDKRVKDRVKECEQFADESEFPDKNIMYDVVYEQEDYPFLPHKL